MERRYRLHVRPGIAPDHLGVVHPSTTYSIALRGLILLVWWLITVAAGGELFAATPCVSRFSDRPGAVVGWSVAFSTHFGNGVVTWLGMPATALNSGAHLGSGLRCSRRDRAADRHDLALCISGLGDFDDKGYLSIG